MIDEVQSKARQQRCQWHRCATNFVDYLREFEAIFEKALTCMSQGLRGSCLMKKKRRKKISCQGPFNMYMSTLCCLWSLWVLPVAQLQHWPRVGVESIEIRLYRKGTYILADIHGMDHFRPKLTPQPYNKLESCVSKIHTPMVMVWFGNV
jgi:hypothetical protein